MVTTIERPSTNGHLPVGGKAVIYVRVSNAKQEDGASLEVQLETCRRYCEKSGLDVVAEFRDVESGLHVDRVQYQQALAMARAKGFDQLVVWRYDRSGRDDAEYMGMLRDFAKQGITLVSASGESPDPLYQKLAGVLAWDESRRISIRVTGSKMLRFQDGKWSGKAVFGYSVQKLEGGGSTLVPSDQAELVTEMFTRYATGKHSLNDLRRHLRETGIIKSRYAILYALRNRTYLGEVPYGKHVTSQFHESPQDITWGKGRHEPLIDTEIFDKVQVLLSEHRSRQRGGTAPKYLFSGLVYCGSCGRKYTGRRTGNGRSEKRWNRYDCSRRNSVGDCQGHSITELRIKEVVIPPIENLLGKLSREDVRTSVRAELVRQEEDARSADVVTKLGAKETLERLEARLSNLEDDYLDRTIAKDRYLKRRDELTSQIKELRAKLAARPHLALPDMEAIFSLAISYTPETLNDAGWRVIIEEVVDRVVIEGHEVRVEWKETFKPLFGLATEG